MPSNGLDFFQETVILFHIMTVRMRHTRSHTRNRRSHHALKTPRLSKCDKCGALHLRHRMCTNCGSYKGREVVDVMSKVLKKEAKKKEIREAKSGVPEKAEKKKAKTTKKTKETKEKAEK